MPVANNGGANSVAVAEHTIMLILAALKKLAWQHNNVVAGKWRVGDFAETRLYELAGKRVGIVGLGNIGKRVVRRLAGFDCQVVYNDIIRLAEHEEDALGVKYVLLDELLKTSDVVSLHVPLTDKTKDMISERELGLMKPTAVLVNTCRGPVVDEMALHKALITKRIAGAGLDVMVDEPPRRTTRCSTWTRARSRRTWRAPRGTTGRRRSATPSTTSSAWPAGRPPLWVIPELRGEHKA